MNTFVRCGSLFTGREDDAQPAGILVFDGEGRIVYAGAEAGAPRRAKADRLIDHSGHFVMPGLIDVHTHLAYGNAKSEEDIDLYSPMEFRALRGLFFAQKCAAAGYTAICSPGDAGQISLSIRNAIKAGLFDGPRVVAAGLEHSELLAAAHEAGVDLGRGAQRLRRSEAEILHEQFQLARMPFAIGGDREPGVGAGEERHPGDDRLL